MLTFSPFATDDYRLHPDRIDLWYYPLHQPLSNQVEVLSPDEVTRANRFYFEHHRRRFRVAHSLKRLILSRYLNLAPDSLEFDHNSHGKPSLAHASGIQFNLSHSSDWAMLAVGCQYELGVDIERFSARPWIDLAQTVFSITEVQRLKQCPRSRLASLFFSIWAQKEAFIKALGLGLAYPTREMTTPIEPGGPIIEEKPGQDWFSHPFMPQVGMAAALCYQPAVTEFRYCRIDDPLGFAESCQ